MVKSVAFQPAESGAFKLRVNATASESRAAELEPVEFQETQRTHKKNPHSHWELRIWHWGASIFKN